MALSDLAYTNAEVTLRISILDVDISSYVKRSDVGTIRTQLDTTFLSEFRASDCQLILLDPNGNFTTSADENFFTMNGWVASGFLAKVEIFAGYRNPQTEEEEEDLLFRGVIITISRDSKSGRVTLNCADNSDLTRENVEGFGIRQNLELEEVSRPSIRGVYEFDSRVSPVSENSTLATLKGTNAQNTAVSLPMTQKNVLDSFGELSEQNFRVIEGRESLLETEEVVDDLTNSSISTDFRAPLRYHHVTNNVRAIAGHYNVRINDLTAVEPTLEDRFFAALGRIQPRLTVDTPDAHYSWQGTVTDFIVEEESGLIYALVSDRVSTILPKLVLFDPQGDTARILHQASSHFEFWKLATVDFDTFYITKTTGTVEQDAYIRAAINPSEWNTAAMPQTSVTKYVRSTNTATDIINTGTTNRLQMATFHYYAPPRDPERIGFLPDTRQNFMLARGVLWYRFASRTAFGLARYKDSDGSIAIEITIPTDGRNNEASFDFAIDEADNKIYGSHTVQTRTNSRLLIYEKTLAASY